MLFTWWCNEIIRRLTGIWNSQGPMGSRGTPRVQEAPRCGSIHFSGQLELVTNFYSSSRRSQFFWCYSYQSLQVQHKWSNYFGTLFSRYEIMPVCGRSPFLFDGRRFFRSSHWHFNIGCLYRTRGMDVLVYLQRRGIIFIDLWVRVFKKRKLHLLSEKRVNSLRERCPLFWVVQIL